MQGIALLVSGKLIKCGVCIAMWSGQGLREAPTGSRYINWNKVSRMGGWNLRLVHRHSSRGLSLSKVNNLLLGFCTGLVTRKGYR